MVEGKHSIAHWFVGDRVVILLTLCKFVVDSGDGI